MPSDEPSNRQSVNTGLRSDHTTPALMLVGCGRACKPLDYKGKHSRELPSDTSLPDELNYFYAHFEANNTETCMRAPAVLEVCIINLSAADVRPLNWSTFTSPQSQTDYQDVYCEHMLTNWQVSKLTFSTSPCPSLYYHHLLSRPT